MTVERPVGDWMALTCDERDALADLERGLRCVHATHPRTGPPGDDGRAEPGARHGDPRAELLRTVSDVLRLAKAIGEPEPRMCLWSLRHWDQERATSAAASSRARGHRAIDLPDHYEHGDDVVTALEQGESPTPDHLVGCLTDIWHAAEELGVDPPELAIRAMAHAHALDREASFRLSSPTDDTARHDADQEDGC
jgi:hypothetical protein